MAANDEILDAVLRHEVGLRRYSNATLRKVIALLNRIDNRLVAEIASRSTDNMTDKRLKALLDAVRSLMSEAYNAATASLADDATALALYESGFQKDLFERTIPVAFDVIKPTAPMLYAAVHSRPFQGRLLKEWGKDLGQAAFKRVRDEIRMGFVEGRTTDQIIRSIRGTKSENYRNGILDINRRSAATMVRTALTHTANGAREEVYRQNEGAIKGVQWVSTLDGRTSAVCRARDGKVYEPGKGPRPPAHPNCRSSTVPILKSWKEMGINLSEAPEGTRSSMNGQVPVSQSYGQWLKKQPANFQDDVLGVTKGKLFRKGGLSLDRFVDRKGQEYTLDQLKKREAEAWAKVAA